MPKATCRDRQRQLLTFVDDARWTSHEQLLQAATDTICPVGHDLLFANLMIGMLDRGDDGLLRLSRAGDEWLMLHGTPAAKWRAVEAPGVPPLRDWQHDALQAWSAHARHGVVEAVTGTGKSRVGVEAAREALDQDFSVIVVVPTVDLVDQWARTFRASQVPGVGVCGDGKRATFATHRVIIGTVQSLYLEPPTRADGKVLLIADECHRYGAGMWKQVLHPTYRRRLGLTATFERNDDGINDLLAYFGGDPVYKIGFPQAIRSDVVAHYDVKLFGVPLTSGERRDYDAAENVLDDCRIRLIMADFTPEPFGAFLQEVQQAATDDEDPAIADIARRYLKAFSERIDILSRAQGKLNAMRQLAPLVDKSRGAIVFTRRVQAAEDLAAALVEEGVLAEPIHSDLTRTTRQERLTDLKVGRVKALVAPTMLDEGIDVPDIDLAVVMGGSKSRRQMIQRMGRVLRLKRDRRKATFVVVYAINTVEDLTAHDGAEGCLDLIIESADSVQDWGTGTKIATSPAQRPLKSTKGQAATQAPQRVEHVATEGAPKPGSTPDSPPDPRGGRTAPAPSRYLRDVDVSGVAMTRQALTSYQRFHGGTDQEAERAIRAISVELLGNGRLVVTGSGHLSLRGPEATVVLSADHGRFVAYQSHADRPAAADPQTGAPPSVDKSRAGTETADVPATPSLADPPDRMDVIDPASIGISPAVIDQARRILPLGGMAPDRAEQYIRQELHDDIAADATVTATLGGRAIKASGRSWAITADGKAITALTAATTSPTIAGSSAQSKDALPVRSPDLEALAAPQDTVNPPSPPRTEPSAMNLVEQIERLAHLRQEGLLTDDEFAAAKALILFR